MSFAMRIASSSVENRAIPATGPNVSSQLIAIVFVTPVRIEGRKNWPSIRSPAHDHLGPVFERIGHVAFHLLHRGHADERPTATPGVKPSPTTSRLTASVNALRNSS